MEHHNLATELETLFKGKKPDDLREFYTLMIERVKREHGLKDKDAESAYHAWQTRMSAFKYRSQMDGRHGPTFDVIIASMVARELDDGHAFLRGYAFHLLSAGVPADEVLGKAKTYLG